MDSGYVWAGIDPGLGGAIAWLNEDGDLMDLRDVPVIRVGKRRVVSYAALRPLASRAVRIVGLEDVHAMPKNGVVASFSLGDSKGTLRGAFGMCSRVELIPSKRWKKHHGIVGVKGDPKAAKQQALDLAADTWPGTNYFKRKNDADRAEAALIALYVMEVNSNE